MISKIEPAVTKSRQTCINGIGTVCKKVEKNGICITAICKRMVAKMPIAINQLELSGTLKAERNSLRQLKT